MTFLYNEMDASETREFESHLQQCGKCRHEAASFGIIRQSIVAWRDEVLLTGFVPATPRLERRSAVAAFKQFFDLSPLWLKGAAAFAVLTFCVLIGLLYVNFSKETPTTAQTDASYTQQDVDRLIKEALAKQQENTSPEKPPTTLATLNPPSRPQRPESKRSAKNRRPLSRAEREQLAADLRLVPIDDELDLISDRINHEEK